MFYIKSSKKYNLYFALFSFLIVVVSNVAYGQIHDFNFKNLTEYQNKCNNQDGQICTIIGWGYQKSVNGFPENRELSMKYYKKGCEVGFLTACHNLAVLYENVISHEKVITNIEQAKLIFEKNCEDDYTLSCFFIARIYLLGKISQDLDYELGLSYLQKTCDIGSSLDCIMASKLAYDFDEGLSLALYELACMSKTNPKYNYYSDKKIQNAINAMACRYLGIGYFSGSEYIKKKNLAKGIKFYERACELKDLSSCLFLAKAYKNGEPKPFTIKSEKVLKYLDMACSINHGESCYNLGLINEKGIYKITNLTTAIYYYRRACENQYESACTKVLNLDE